MNESFGSHGPIVLTGATGFLGRAVLAELLDKSDVQVVGLIRANSHAEAHQQETRLGLNTADWNQLANSVGEVIHCAASVRFDLDLAEADAAYLPADRAGNFRNSYERTKARAERLLREQNEVPVAIYRPSIVGGNTETGFTDNWNVLYVPMRMIAKGQLPVLPIGGEQLVDTVGVDYVAAAIVHLAIRHSNSNRRKAVGYHLTAGPEPFTVAQFASVSTRLARLFDNEPSTPELVPPARWKLLTSSVAAASKAPKKAKRLRRWGRLGVRGLKGFAPYAPYTCVSSRFENNREQEILEAACIKMPSPLTYLETIGTYAIGTDFGRDPITAHYSPDEELIS